MKENAANVQFIKVTKENVLSFLGEARNRIVIAKAGYFVDEIDKLLDQAEKDVRCNLYVDTGENSIRYGFGEQAALELIKKNLELLNVQSANYIRMAIIIVDDAVMVYSPVALSWEQVPKQIEFPNGFIGGKDLANSLLTNCHGRVHIVLLRTMSACRMDLWQTCPTACWTITTTDRTQRRTFARRVDQYGPSVKQSWFSRSGSSVLAVRGAHQLGRAETSQ